VIDLVLLLLDVIKFVFGWNVIGKLVIKVINFEMELDLA